MITTTFKRTFVDALKNFFSFKFNYQSLYQRGDTSSKAIFVGLYTTAILLCLTTGYLGYKKFISSRSPEKDKEPKKDKEPSKPIIVKPEEESGKKTETTPLELPVQPLDINSDTISNAKKEKNSIRLEEIEDDLRGSIANTRGLIRIYQNSATEVQKDIRELDQLVKNAYGPDSKIARPKDRFIKYLLDNEDKLKDNDNFQRAIGKDKLSSILKTSKDIKTNAGAFFISYLLGEGFS